MLALIIIGSVILFFTVIFMFPVVFSINYDKGAVIKIRLLFFDLLREKERKKSKKPRKLKKSYQKTSEPGTPISGRQSVKPPKKQKSPEKDILEMDMKLVRVLLESSSKPIKRLVRKIRITGLAVESTVGGSDAARAAINFGLQNAAVYSSLAWLKTVANIGTYRVNIYPDFMNEESTLKLHCNIKIKIGTVLACLFALMLRIIKHKEINERKNKNGGTIKRTA